MPSFDLPQSVTFRSDLDDPDRMAMRLTSSTEDTRATPDDVEQEQEFPVEAEEEVTKLNGRENGVERTKDEEGGCPAVTPTINGCRDRKGNKEKNSDLKIDSTAELNGVNGNHPSKSDESRNHPKETVFDWLVLFCAFGSNVIFGMDFNSFSVFYPSLVEYFQATTAQVGWCLSIEAFMGSVLCIFSSYPTELYGCRLPGIIGSVIFCVGVAITAFAPNLPVIYFTYGIVAGLGASVCGLTSSIIIQQRFHRNRGLISGISVLGFSVGGIIGPSVANLLLQHFNWRGAYLIMSALYAHRIAFAILFITPPQYLTKRTQHTDPTQQRHSHCRAVGRYIHNAFNFSILRKQKVYALYIGVICIHMLLMTGYLQHSVNRAIHTGIPRELAFWASSLIGMSNTVTRVIVSFVGNLSCVNRCLLFAFGLSISVISVLVMLLSPGFVGTMTSSVLFGIMAGCTGTIATVVTVDLVGVELLTRCLSIQAFIIGFFRLIASPFIGWIFDVTQNYDVAFAVLGCLSFIASLMMVAVYFLQKRQMKKSNTKPPEQQIELPLAVVVASTHELSHC